MDWWNIGKATDGNPLEVVFRDLECPYCNAVGHFGPPVFEQHTVEQRGRQAARCYSVLKCLNCGNYAFMIYTEMHDYSGNEIVDYRLAPARRRKSYTAPKEWPDVAQNSFIEASKARDSESWMSLVMMCRRAVQAAMRDRQAQGGTLYKEIEDLKAKNVLTVDMVEWAHAIRDLGNVGAHPDPNDPEPSKVDAEEVYQFTFYLLHYLYTLPAQVAEHRQRRKKKK